MNTKTKNPIRRYVSLLACGALVCAFAAFAFVRTALAQQPGLAGFTIKEIRFDESVGAKKPTPKLPATWRFIGVSNGEKANSNNLWFQDKDGSIYLVQGFTTYGEFIVREGIHKLSSGQ